MSRLERYKNGLYFVSTVDSSGTLHLQSMSIVVNANVCFAKGHNITTSEIVWTNEDVRDRCTIDVPSEGCCTSHLFTCTQVASMHLSLSYVQHKHTLVRFVVDFLWNGPVKKSNQRSLSILPTLCRVLQRFGPLHANCEWVKNVLYLYTNRWLCCRRSLKSKKMKAISYRIIWKGQIKSRSKQRQLKKLENCPRLRIEVSRSQPPTAFRIETLTQALNLTSDLDL